jgi:iron complex outermembrane receptor protein
MRKYFTILSVLLTSSVFSQTQITGLIADSIGTPIPFATLALLSLPDSIVVKGSISDESGHYLLAPIKSGNYVIKTFAIGYLGKVSQAIALDSAGKKELVLDLRLSRRGEVLKEVAVYGVKKIVDIQNGNITVNVEDSPLAKGNSVYDLLVKLPGVGVEDDKITIQGKAGVIVMLDGRPQKLSDNALVNLLKGISADLIKSIEILKNPPVKYDASGTSGMINIISKKTTLSGWTGTVFSSYSQGFYERLIEGASLNYRSNKILWYANISGEGGHSLSDQKFNKRFSSGSNSTELDNENIVTGTEMNLNYTTGIDWMLSPTDVMGIKIEGSAGSNTARTAGVTSVMGNNGLGFDHLIAKINQPDNWQSNNFDINYEHKLDTLGSIFAFVTDYTYLPENLSSENFNIFYNSGNVPVLPSNNYRSFNASLSKVLSSRCDLVKTIDTLSSFETGLKAVSVITSNDYLFQRDFSNNGIYSNDPTISNNFQYQEVTYAGYINYIRSLKKLDMQLGVRMENTTLSGKSSAGSFALDKNYFQVFPNIALGYKLNDNQGFHLNLTRRTDRPNFADLNPFKLFVDPYTFQEGNPFLLPDFTNRAELSFSSGGIFSTSVAYSYTQNVMMQYITQNDSSKTSIQSLKNMKSNNNLEYSLFYRKTVAKQWNVFFGGSVVYRDYQGDLGGSSFHQTGINYYGNLSNIILLGKNVKLEVNGVYIGPNIYGVVHINPKWMASLAVKTSLFKDKLDLTVGIDDVFYTFITQVTSDYQNQYWTSVKTNDSRRFKLSLTYKFGKMKIGDRNVKASNEEEKDRLKH